jgi:hypothetical protein
VDFIKGSSMRRSRLRRALGLGYALVLGLVSFSLLLWPGIELSRALFDPALGGPEPAAQTFRWHRALSPAYADWARQRVESARAAQLSMHDIAGTEWPLFGSVFFLRATENLDQAWQRQSRGERPAVYARAAIDAAAELLADPNHAHWVKLHWGERDYLRRENVFYRMLLIDGIATQLRLTGETPHRALLVEQVESLAIELDRSEAGLLADYPGQTFPADVAAAWHAILRADAVLGSDHSALAQRGLRGFVGDMAPQLELPPYAWFDDPTPQPTEVRGCANAWLLHHAPFVWPQQARLWAQRNREYFWEADFWISGNREFARGRPHRYGGDIDSGPVIAGYGTAATAFGIGAARSLGQFEDARALGLQAIAASLPLPNGRLLLPRLLSDLSDAPLLGEAALIYNLSQPPAPEFAQTSNASAKRRTPAIVWSILAMQLLLGSAGLWRSLVRLRSALMRSV